MGAGKVAITRLLLDQDAGNYFTETGAIRPELAMQYVKARTWSLDPQIKSPHATIPREEGYVYADNAIFSIDGERYPSQRITAAVMHRALPIHI